MSIINLFTSKAPVFNFPDGVITFDAVLEDTLEASVDYTQFPLEFGANASDHGIIRPITWRIIGLVSNNPIGLDPTQAIGAITNFFDSPSISELAGLSSGFLAGSNETRAGATLELLIALMYAREPFDVDAVDIQLSNMVITNILRIKDAENENGLEFVADLMELPLISTVIKSNEPSQDQLSDLDAAKTQSSSFVKKGEISTLDKVKDEVQRRVDRVTNTITELF